MQKMQLFGSTTSPYVRRLRLYMQDIPHDFVLVDIFNSRDRAEIKRQNPTLKVPMLKDGEQTVLDSGSIYRYLQTKLSAKPLTWDQQNILTSIDAANDSLVQLLILSRSEIDTSSDKLYFRIQRERLDVIFTHLEQQAKVGTFVHWNYLSISLFCLLDWVIFRQLHDISSFTHLNQLHDNWNQLAICHKTDPRV
jgi:glutathione S-transferase